MSFTNDSPRSPRDRWLIMSMPSHGYVPAAIPRTQGAKVPGRLFSDAAVDAARSKPRASRFIVAVGERPLSWASDGATTSNVAIRPMAMAFTRMCIFFLPSTTTTSPCGRTEAGGLTAEPPLPNHAAREARAGVAGRQSRRVRTEHVLDVGVVAVRDVGEVVPIRMHDDRAAVRVEELPHREPVGLEPHLGGPVVVHEQRGHVPGMVAVTDAGRVVVAAGRRERRDALPNGVHVEPMEAGGNLIGLDSNHDLAPLL